MGFKARRPKLKVNHRRYPKSTKSSKSLIEKIAEPLGTPPPKPEPVKK
jgi:hypothetical protein